MYYFYFDINKNIFLILLEYNIIIFICDILIKLLKNSRMVCLYILVFFMYNEGKKYFYIRERINFV